MRPYLLLVGVAIAGAACERVGQLDPSVGRLIGRDCTPDAGCPNPLVCVSGDNFAHQIVGYTCEVRCTSIAECPRGWACGRVFDGPGSGAPGICLR